MKYPKVMNKLENVPDTVIAEEKVDGCFEYNAMITLADGTHMKIGEIVNRQLPVEVLSYNFEKGVVEPKRVVGWFKNGKTDYWLHIKVKGKHGRHYSLKCTPNHRIFIAGKGWVEAKDVTKDDKVLLLDSYYNEITEQVLQGILLGDGYIHKGRLSYSHSAKQKVLVEILSRVLKGFNLKIDRYTSGYGSEMIRLQTGTHELFKKYETHVVNGRKYILWELKLTPLSLAWWYMDDGHFNTSDKQYGYAVFHTEGFAKEEVERLSYVLRTQFGLENKIFFSKGWCIRLTTESTKRLFSMIHFYIPKELQYKIAEEYRLDKTYWDIYEPKSNTQLIEREILSIEMVKTSNMMKYDIEVEDNHNFFVRGVLVHNSQFRIVVEKDGTRWYGSKRVDFKDGREPDQMFSKAIEEAEKLKIQVTNVTIFCEYLRQPKHNTLKYSRVPKHNMILFDVFLHDENRWMTYEEKAKFAEEIDLEVVPKLYEGRFPSLEKLKSLIGESILGGTKMEGVVLKNYEQVHPVLGTKGVFFKYVRDEFKELNHAEWRGKRSSKAFIDQLVDEYFAEARLKKAVFRLRDEGKLTGTMKDVPALMKEFAQDLFEEEGEEIRKKILQRFEKEFKHKIIRRIPLWYKDYLFKQIEEVSEK